MSETKAQPEAFKPTQEDRSYLEVLKALVGKKITVVNPESYEAAPMVGFQLKENFYPAKIAGWGNDYIIIHTVVAMSKKEGGQQPVQQYIPLDAVKRVSVLKTGIYIHI